MIPFFDYRPQYRELRPQIDAAIDRVLESGRVILGPEVEAFERELAQWVGAAGAVGLASGTDAVTLGLRAVGVAAGDEVLTVSNAGAPPVSAIRNAGAIPRFVDVDPGTLLIDPSQIEGAVTPRTRAVLAVHLFGRAAELGPLAELCDRLGLVLVEDCAQALGARYGARQVGTFGRVGCFSFYPTKTLGAFGDGGACVSDDAAVLERLRLLRQYGWQGGDRSSRVEGTNSRLDELQAAVLRVKLTALERALDARLAIARRYVHGLDGRGLALPEIPASGRHAFHLFVVRPRDRVALAGELDRRGIGYGVHYPEPAHLMQAYAFLGQGAGSLPHTEAACRSVLSLPVFPGLPDDAVDRVIEAVAGVE